MLNRTGFTLVEIMISLSLSSISILAASSFIASTSTSLYKLDQVSRLQNELNIIGSVLYEDIRNTGYDGLAVQRIFDETLTSSPFTQIPLISEFTGEVAHSCILFTHDINHDGELTDAAPNERRGYRLRDGALEVRIGGRDCQQNGWQDLTANDFMQINELLFKTHTLKDKHVIRRTISIDISATLRLDNSIERSIHIEIPLYNAAS